MRQGEWLCHCHWFCDSHFTVPVDDLDVSTVPATASEDHGKVQDGKEQVARKSEKKKTRKKKVQPPRDESVDEIVVNSLSDSAIESAAADSGPKVAEVTVTVVNQSSDPPLTQSFSTALEWCCERSFVVNEILED